MNKTRSFKQISPRKTATRRNGIETRKRILESTLTILERDGYSTLTTNHIAKEADISPASLYRFFPNKESILWTLTAEWHESIIAGYNECVEKHRASLSLSALLAKCYLVTLDNDYSQSPAYREIHLASSLIPELREIFLAHSTNISQLIAELISSYGYKIHKKERDELANFIFMISIQTLDLTSSFTGKKQARLLDWSLRLLDFIVVDFIENDHSAEKN